jgi:hypothetical protein
VLAGEMMRKLNDFIIEDSNQFGPGTDLVVSLTAIFLVLIVVIGHFYSLEKKKALDAIKQVDIDKIKIGDLEQKIRDAALAKGGNFQLAERSFQAGEFDKYPVTRFLNPERAQELVGEIIQQYHTLSAGFPYLFIIGHANALDDPKAQDKSYRARLERNWEYAGRRAALVAGLIQESLTDEERERVVVVTTGEFDMKRPDEPHSQENAWVEVVFAREWKLPARNTDLQ